MSRIDIDLTGRALASSTLSHGLAILGDRWTVQVMLGTFLGLKRFEQWQQVLGIPRNTLAQRLRSLSALGLLRPRLYQDHPPRRAYHGTAKSMAMFPQVLMMWTWEKRWGGRQTGLPDTLLHRSCGHAFTPVLTCLACQQDADVTAMKLRLSPVEALLQRQTRQGRASRLVWRHATREGLDQRVDRWSLLIVAAVVLGCHHFDQLSHVLGIGSATLARRLQAMVEAGLLTADPDRSDRRRRIYTLTTASRDLLPYIVCLSRWAGEQHLGQSSSIIPIHSCGQPFQARVACSHCRQELRAWDVLPQYHAQAVEPQPDRASDGVRSARLAATESAHLTEGASR